MNSLVKIFFPLMLSCMVLINANATTYTVNAVTDAGTGAGTTGDLRYCINTANGDATAGPHIINFAIPGAGPYSITLSSSYTLIRDMIIDATTQTGYIPGAPTPMVELKNSPSQAFVINSGAAASGSTIKGFIINNCNAQGILIQSPNNKIKGCYIGINAAGTAASGNHASAILLNGCCGFNTNGNIIGGIIPADRNIISGNITAHGIEGNTSSNNVIIGNYIGLDKTGTTPLPNAFHGITLYGGGINNKIGGNTSDSSNVISGNGQDGVNFNNIFNSRIAGNLIGTAATGFSDLGNSNHGIFIGNASSNISMLGNTISGNNQIGINIVGVGTNILVKKNYIGTSSNGLVAVATGVHGIQVQGVTSGLVIGGNRLTEGNIISNSGVHGINLDPGADGTIIKGNIIGSDINGTAFFGNGVIGFVAKSNNLVIGGTSNNEGNIIVDSKNSAVGCGILLANANNAVVKGNYIGVGLDLSAIPNHAEGINISVEDIGQTAANNRIEYNTIAYNLGHGINVGDALPIVELGAGGTVSNNDEYGNLIVRNSIYCNVIKGISLNKTAVAADRGNTGRSTPAVNTGTSTSTVVNGTASANDSIHLYVMSTCSNCASNPQGKTYLGGAKADGAGNWTYTAGSAIAGDVTVTATDAVNNTSEFSTCFVLPIHLISFTASVNANQEVVIHWTTLSETNNNKFIIERSENGKDFSPIGEEKGAGTTTHLLNYSFQDPAILSGIVYYRLKQIDFDGHYEYSETIAVATSDEMILSIYPNPASDFFNVQLLGITGAYKITLVDLFGRIVKEKSAGSGESIKIETGNLASGQYLLMVSGGEYSSISKVVVR
jgi:hypothetical protein